MCPIWEYFSCSSQTYSFIVMCGGEGFSQDHLLGSEFWRHLIFNKSFDDGISMILKYFSSMRTLFKACMDTWIFEWKVRWYKLYHAAHLNLTQSRGAFRPFWVWCYLHEKNIYESKQNILKFFQSSRIYVEKRSTCAKLIFYVLCVCFVIRSLSTSCLLLRNHSYWIVAVKCKRY